MDSVEKDLKKIGVREWRGLAHSREEWKNIVKTI